MNSKQICCLFKKTMKTALKTAWRRQLLERRQAEEATPGTRGCPWPAQGRLCLQHPKALPNGMTSPAAGRNPGRERGRRRPAGPREHCSLPSQRDIRSVSCQSRFPVQQVAQYPRGAHASPRQRLPLHTQRPQLKEPRRPEATPPYCVLT